ncbi:hypothetical protein [Streptomyces sp. NPDC055642]
MTTTSIAADIVRRYADDIAFVAEDSPATTLDSLIDQLATAADEYDTAGITGHEDVETAATLLAEAGRAEDEAARDTFLKRADVLLRQIGDMTSEYRTMVG